MLFTSKGLSIACTEAKCLKCNRFWIIRSMYQGAKDREIHRGELELEFCDASGVKQNCILSTCFVLGPGGAMLCRDNRWETAGYADVQYAPQTSVDESLQAIRWRLLEAGNAHDSCGSSSRFSVGNGGGLAIPFAKNRAGCGGEGREIRGWDWL